MISDQTALNIAYIANYQGSDLLCRRRLLRNRALAGSQKIATLAKIMADIGWRVTVFSLGATAEHSTKFYPAFQGRISEVALIPVSYQAEWDIPIVGRICGTLGLLKSLYNANRVQLIDLILVYNCGLPESLAARMASIVFSKPIVLEYEDDVSQGPNGRRTWRQRCHSLGLHLMRKAVRGVLAASPQLLAQLNVSSGCVLHGVLSDDLAGVHPPEGFEAKKLRFMFSGSIQEAKGVDKLCEGWMTAKLPECEMHIVGEGPLLDAYKKRFAKVETIHFHGFVPRSQLVELMNSAHVLVNPHCTASEIGSVFPFKMIEYIGTGRPTISTPMAPLPGQLGSGVLYTRADSSVDLGKAIQEMYDGYPEWLIKAAISHRLVWAKYGSNAVRESLIRVFEGAALKPDAQGR